MPEGIIESLDHEARGITRLDGKAIFVEGALPLEKVQYTSFRKKPSYEIARIGKIIKESSARVTPKCPHFGVCGGCSLQHFAPNAQVAAKQRILEDNLWHIGHLRAETLLAPIYGAPWHYRHRARLSVRFVAKKGGILVGFHEKKSSFVADMQSCAILPLHISNLLLPLRELIGAMDARETIPQIELALGDKENALVLRVLAPLSLSDEARLKAFADTHHITFYLQPKGPATVFRFYPPENEANKLFYALPDFEVIHDFSPTQFTQVNPEINKVMVRRAMALLAPQKGEKIADFFCGLGNFTLPIARLGAQVFGVEGNAQLIACAEQNAAKNGLQNLTSYSVSDLFKIDAEALSALGEFDKMLIDPPREGAIALVNAISETGCLKRIVYVSCNPATLARDAAILVAQKGFRLTGAGIINMFPNTSHVESIALFERD